MVFCLYIKGIEMKKLVLNSQYESLVDIFIIVRRQINLWVLLTLFSYLNHPLCYIVGFNILLYYIMT